MLITPVQIRWNDMDAFAHVNNAGYVAYLEIARVDYCAKKLNVKELYAVGFIVARIEIDLVSPIEFGERAEVLTNVSRIGMKSWDFTAVIRHPDSGKIYAKARTVQVSFDHRTKTSMPIPESTRKILEEDLMAFQAISH